MMCQASDWQNTTRSTHQTPLGSSSFLPTASYAAQVSACAEGVKEKAVNKGRAVLKQFFRVANNYC